MKKTANIWEYKVGVNAIIANFMFIWKSRKNQNMYQNLTGNKRNR